MDSVLEIQRPIEINFKEITVTQTEWNKNIQIIFILKGSLDVQVNDSTYHLTEGQIILINAFDLYSLKSSICHIVIIEFNPLAFQDQFLSSKKYFFDCNSATTPNEAKLNNVKHFLAKLVKISLSTKNIDYLLMYSTAYELLHHLVTYFYVEPIVNQLQSRERISLIIQYVNTNFKNPITLNDVADQFYLSPPYISKLFRDAFGTNFKDYLTSLRLNNAIRDISNLDLTLELIAEQNGFSNTRSFVKAFKDKYNLLPSVYRAQLQEDSYSISNLRKSTTTPSLIFHHEKRLEKLAEYLNSDKNYDGINEITKHLTELPQISASQKGHKLSHNFKKTTSVGTAKQILLSETQKMLTSLQKDVGFQYIKFHGIFDDDMMVYSEDSSGKPVLTFILIDMAIDFLLSINLKPMIQLSFMPSALASDLNKNVTVSKSNTSLPKDYFKWCYLVESFVVHLENRYGTDVVRKWPFYLWSTPDMPEILHGFKKEDYFHFYKLTYHAVKKVDSEINFGGPPLINDTIEQGDWVDDFLKYTEKNNCRPEFLCYNFYPITSFNKLTLGSLTSTNSINHSTDALKDSINKVKNNNRHRNWNFSDIYITEWNHSISHRELLHDTSFKPVYIVKNILENYDRLSSYGFWGLSDLIEETHLASDVFHGGIGIFTFNGIKKAQYYAFALLAKLGDYLIGRGDGYFITSKGTSIQIILYNYQHYSSLYASGEMFDMTFTDRYTPFPNLTTHKYVVPLTDLQMNDYFITETILNRNNGSAFDKWIDLGALPLETLEEVEYLKSISVPRIQKSHCKIEDGKIIISRTLEPHEVRLIELTPKKLM